MNDTQQIKDKIDVVDLLGEYMVLKPAGINYKGLCPFHREKSPSFMVNRERQRWHCFGCSKSGDIFTFLQELEGMEFIEVLKYLADRAGVTLENTRGSEIQGNQKNRLKEICETAARFYHEFLLRMPASEPARDYLQKRGLNDETIKKWRIGFIPDQWELLTQYLLKKGYGIEDIIAAGLTIKKEGATNGKGFYDRFRGRIMFPIFDMYGAVVGFTGRVLVETEKSGGKYVNTPETPIYNKSSIVFALNFAKNIIKQKDLIVMVEGQMDVIACHQAGMENVVATSGTAMTEKQVQLLKRYSENMALAFDADAAGQNAAKRGIDIALSEGMNVRVIRIPEGAGKDPDEVLKKDPAVWFKAVEDSRDIMVWYIERAFSLHDPKTPQGKQKIAEEVLTEIARIPGAVIQDHWLNDLASKLHLETSVLRDELSRMAQKAKPTPLYGASLSKPEAVKPKPVEAPKTRIDGLFDRALGLLFSHPEKAALFFQKFLEDSLRSTRNFALYEELKKVYTSGSTDFSALNQEHGENISLLLMQTELDGNPSETFDIPQEFELISQEIKSEWVKNRRKQLSYELDLAEKEGRRDDVNRLIQEFQSII
jgi:DNA primase